MARIIAVQSVQEVDAQLQFLNEAAEHTHRWLQRYSGTPMALLHALKFEPVGLHPLLGHALNVIEQVNQTATYMVALEAARLLFELHPEEIGYQIAPGADMAQALDIMSYTEGRVGAETFAAVDPRNNSKLKKDLAKLAARVDQHRYVFFSSPRFPATQRRVELEVGGVQVWSIATKLT